MSKLTRTYIEVISHILLWTLPTYLIIRYDLMSFEYLHGRYFTFPLIISVILNMLIVYFNIFVLFPALNKKKLTPVLYSLVLIFIIILIAFLKVQIDNQFVWHYFSRRTSDHG